MDKFCMFCREKLPMQARFCRCCGRTQPDLSDKPQDEVLNEEVRITPDEPQPVLIRNESAECAVKKSSVPAIVRNAILLAVAVILFALSFVPFIKMEQNISQNVEGINVQLDMDVEFSPIDAITFFFDSLKSLDEEELMDSKIADELLELGEDIEDEILVGINGSVDFTPEGKKIMKKVIVLTARQIYQSEDYTTGPTVILPMIACSLYILLTLALLVFAILNMTSILGEVGYSYLLRLLAGVPGLVLVRYVTYFMFSGIRNTSMAWGSVLSLILSAAAVIFVIVMSFANRWHEKSFNIPLRAVASVLSVLAICMTLSPIMTTTIEATFSGRDTESEAHIPIYSSIFGGFDFTETEWDELDALKDKSPGHKKEYFRDAFDTFEIFTKPQVNSGLADLNNLMYIRGMLTVDNPDSLITVFSLVTALYFLFAIFMSMLLQQNLRCLMSGEYSKVQSLIGKIAGVVLAALILAAAISFLALLSESLFTYAPKKYSIFFSAGTILLTLFAVAACVLPGEKMKNTKAPITTEEAVAPEEAANE